MGGHSNRDPQNTPGAKLPGVPAVPPVSDPVADVLVCDTAETNLFSLEAKFIPTNTISASRLIDVSAWSGTSNELFFGLMGGTSTNCTLQVEDIRFYSLQQPRLEIGIAGDGFVLSWPTTAAGTRWRLPQPFFLLLRNR